MKVLFIHALSSFSLANWYLRDIALRIDPQTEWYGLEMNIGNLESHEKIRRTITSFQPDLVGFSCHFWSTDAFVDVARWVKLYCPEAKTVFGGPQVSSKNYAKHLLANSPQIDYVVIGQGEEAISVLVQRVDEAALAQTTNLLSRTGGGPRQPLRKHRREWDRGLIFSPENLPLALELSGLSTVSYQSYLGCKNRCAYCKGASGPPAFLDMKIIEKELAFLCSFHIANICLCDSHLGGTAERAKQILSLLALVNTGHTSIKINVDLSHLDREYLELARKAKADITCVGVQTTNSRCLKIIGRRGIESFEDKIKLLLEYYPQTSADLIVGLPQDSYEGVAESFRHVLNLGFQSAKIYRLSAFPGTQIFEDMPGSLGGGRPILAQTGEVLHSKFFPASRNFWLTRLIHTLGIAFTLPNTKKILPEGQHVLDRLAEMNDRQLAKMHQLLYEAPPSAILNEFSDLGRNFANIFGKGAPLLDAIGCDLLARLCDRCVQTGVSTLFQLDSGQARPVLRILLLLNNGENIVCDLTTLEIKRVDWDHMKVESLPPNTVVLDVRNLAPDMDAVSASEEGESNEYSANQ